MDIWDSYMSFCVLEKYSLCNIFDHWELFREAIESV